MTRTQIYLPKDQIETLRQIAQRKKSFKEGLLNFAKRVNEYGIKAPKDLATNLDKYLIVALLPQ